MADRIKQDELILITKTHRSEFLVRLFLADQRGAYPSVATVSQAA